jgi:nicotinamide-nucleotide amidase
MALGMNTVPDQAMIDGASALLDLCKRKKLTLATAESCTGGLVAATISEIAGSSAVLDRGFVTYSNTAKQQMLGVTPATIDIYGAVSRECAQEMAKGALTHASVDLAVSITGIAGPTGAVPGKPIGLVFFCAASRSGRTIIHDRKYGDIGRAKVRRLSVLQALAMLQELAEKEEPRPPAAGEG